jgi:hypothetical protein
MNYRRVKYRSLGIKRVFIKLRPQMSPFEGGDVEGG